MAYRLYPLYLYIVVSFILFVIALCYNWNSINGQAGSFTYLSLFFLTLLFGYLLLLSLKTNLIIVIIPIAAMLLMYLLFFYLFTSVIDF